MKNADDEPLTNGPVSRRRMLSSAAVAAAGAGALALPRVAQAAQDSSLGADQQTPVRSIEARATSGPREGGSGAGWTYRHDWGDKNNQWKLTLWSGAINRNSTVFVEIGEGAAGGGKFVGAARYTVHNVAPFDGGVTIWLNIEWSSPIRLYVDYLVIPL